MGALLSTTATPARTGWLAGAATATALVVVLVTGGALLLVVPSGPDALSTPEREVEPALVALVSAVLAAVLVTAWLVRFERPRMAGGIAVAVIGTLVPLWAAWEGLPERLGVLVVPLALMVPPAVALALAGVGDRLVRASWGVSAAALLVHTVSYDPFLDPSCLRICLRVAAPLEGIGSADLTLRGLQATLVLAMVAAGLSLLSLLIGAPAHVVTSLPAMATVLVAGSLDAVHFARLAAPVQAAPSRVLLVAGVGLTGVVLAAEVLRTLRTRRRVDLVLRALEDARPGDRAARNVAFSVPDEARWILVDGTEVTPPGSPSVSEPTVLLDTGKTLPDANGLTPARRLGLANARLEALASARLREVHEAQRRSVQRSDDEQRRIERDLHDGAQQHLVGAIFRLGVAARSATEPERTVLHRLGMEVDRILERLRRLTHGALPPVLSDEGLVAALDELALEPGAALRWTATGVEALRPDLAAALYLTVVAVRSEADAGGIDLVVRSEGGMVRWSMRLPGRRTPVGLALEVTDRLEAVGGEVRSSVRGADAVVEVVLQCGS